MGSHIKIRNGATGAEETVDETATPQEVREKFGLSPDFSFVTAQGKRIPEGQEIGRYVREGEVITPVTEPKFGASPPIFSNMLMAWKAEEVRAQFKVLKARIKDADLSPDSSMILIPRYALDTTKFNKSHTRLLISFNRNFQWMGGPAFYVDRDLRIHHKKSQHLDEYLTEEEMLRLNFVKLCWYNPARSSNIVVVIQHVINFLERLNK